VPAVQRPLQRRRDFFGELSLARAGLAFDQQRPAERYRGIDRHHQVGSGDITFAALET
jgi:hypothetical protein